MSYVLLLPALFLYIIFSLFPFENNFTEFCIHWVILHDMAFQWKLYICSHQYWKPRISFPRSVDIKYFPVYFWRQNIKTTKRTSGNHLADSLLLGKYPLRSDIDVKSEKRKEQKSQQSHIHACFTLDIKPAPEITLPAVWWKPCSYVINVLSTCSALGKGFLSTVLLPSQGT